MAGMKFLAKAKLPQPGHSAKYWLHKHFTGAEPDRGLDTVHGSELTKPEGVCPRAYVLSDLTKAKPGVRYYSTSENLTFRMGRVMQDQTVHAFADMGKAICHWKCMACRHLHQFCSRPFKCSVCQFKVFEPVEVRFESAVSGASCGVDMLLALGEGKLRAFELKTMAADQFKTLVAPLAEHRLRTNLYLRIISELNAQLVEPGRDRPGECALYEQGRLRLRRRTTYDLGAQGEVLSLQGIRS